MANSKSGILSSVIPALIFSFIFFSCKSDTAVDPPPAQLGIKGVITDSAGVALSDVKICLTYYKNFFPADSSNSSGISKTRLSKIGSINDYQFQLYQNYPNPVTDKTFFRFSIPSEGEVSFKILDKLSSGAVYSYSDNLVAGLYQMERNLVDSLKLKNGIYRYTLTFRNKNGETFSDTKELLFLSGVSYPNITSDAAGKYFLPYSSIFAGDTVNVKPDEYTGSEYIMGNAIYLQFQKDGYYTIVIQTLLLKDILLEKNIIMRKIK